VFTTSTVKFFLSALYIILVLFLDGLGEAEQYQAWRKWSGHLKMWFTPLNSLYQGNERRYDEVIQEMNWKIYEYSQNLKQLFAEKLSLMLIIKIVKQEHYGRKLKEMVFWYTNVN
jgi:hypothetical protein